MVHAAHQTALQVCATKTTPSEGGKHYMPRPMSKKRHKLIVKLGVINQIESRLAGLILGSAATLEEVQQRNKPNKSLCHFIARFKELCEGLLADDTPYNQLSGMKRIIKSQIENMDKAYHNDCVQQARKQQQQLISKHPKQANKDIFSTSTGQPRAGMVALQDPITQEIKSEPDKLETWSMLSFQHHFTL
jgi:long-subunit acyl-CoA synthetase (AMP-forming)